jgi:aquaporin Z
MKETALSSLQQHWPEYLIEAWGLGTFMISACLFTVFLAYPASPAVQWITNPFLRRLLIGVAMGLTAISIIRSPWGKQSGAHLNPSLTWTFFRLKKIAKWDAVFYSLSQFAGGVAGVMLVALFLPHPIAHPAVRYAVTLPGPAGPLPAFFAELIISFFLMFTVLQISNHPKFNRFTPFFAGMLVASFITLEAPFSGMSMNPARTFGSAFSAHIWTFLWIYFVAPPLGMLLAAEIYVRRKGLKEVFCAKFDHTGNKRCIFRCEHPALLQKGRQMV